MLDHPIAPIGGRLRQQQGARQFDLYHRLLKDDPDTCTMFEEIAKDERFHIAYSKKELDRYASKGRSGEARWAVTKVWGRRIFQAWMRFAHILGNCWAWILLSLFFLVVITPLGLIYRLCADPLRIKARKPAWAPMPNQFDRREDATLQS